MTSLSVAALQALPETQPSMFHDEFGLAPCTKSCAESCGFTCGRLSCTHTAGVTQQEDASEAAVLKAQEEELKRQRGD